MTPPPLPSLERIKIQAEKNKRLSEILIKLEGEKKYFDWVATTAFYSALQFVTAFFEREKPIVKVYGIEKEITGDIWDFINYIPQYKPPHTVRLEILKTNYPAVYANYHPLYTLSDRARYYCYDVKSEEATKALNYLNEIRKWHTSKKVQPEPPTPPPQK